VDSVTDPLDSVLVELEQFGKVNDASTAERTRRMLNITRDTGEFLAVLVRATLARRVLEIGKRLFNPRRQWDISYGK
jgi:predicted O-methyltransferase YrrM